MSRKNSPRKLKLKKLPRGHFTWKLQMHLDYTSNRGLPQYARNDSSRQNLPNELYEFLDHNLIGKYHVDKLHERNHKKEIVASKLVSILLDNATDVALFKLAFGHYIRQIYQIVLED